MLLAWAAKWKNEGAGKLVNAFYPGAVGTGLNGFIELFGRVESLTDEPYELVVEWYMLVQIHARLEAEGSGSL